MSKAVQRTSGGSAAAGEDDAIDRRRRAEDASARDDLGEYLARHGTDAVTAGMDEALAGIDQRPDAFLTSANRSVLAKSKW